MTAGSRVLKILAAIAVLALGSPANAEEQKHAPLADTVAKAFIAPGQSVDIGGRHLNLNCMGSGSRTVLFESGGSDWSVIWALVQPVVAKQFRACSYDRAGLGYSDPSMLPRTPAAIVEDLHQLVLNAKLQTPFILVGHSLGGFNAKLYTALHPSDVAGLILVDPAEERQYERSVATISSQYGEALAAKSELVGQAWFGWLLDRYGECSRLAANAPMDPQSDIYKRCSDPVRPALGQLIAAERQRVQVSPAYQRAQASEILNSVYGNRDGDAVYRRLFKKSLLGDKPLIVLTHGDYDRTDPLEALDQTLMILLHRETAALSNAGYQRTVEGSGHNIEIDRPDAVIEAIREVEAMLDNAPRHH